MAGLISAIEAAVRYSFGETDINSPLAWTSLNPAESIHKTKSGANITGTSSLKQPAYWTMVRSKSEDLAKLPLPVKRYDGRSVVEARDNSVHELLNVQASEMVYAMAFRESYNFCLFHYGNAYAQIEWSVNGQPVGLHLIHPSRVTIEIDKNGDYFYAVHSSDISPVQAVPLRPYEVLHAHDIGLNGISGIPLYSLASESVGLAIQAEAYASSYFKNKATPSVVLIHPNNLKPEAMENLRDGWKTQFGGADRGHGVGILGEDVKVQEIGFNPKDSQSIETREFQIEEILRFGRFPTSKAGHHKRSTFTNIESLAREYVDDTLTPAAARIEQEFTRKLFIGRDKGLFVEHNFNGLLRGDAIKRSSFYKSMFYMGVYTINEIRRKENENPIEGPEGDTRWIQSNMLPSDKALEGKDTNGKSAGDNKQGIATDAESYVPLVADALKRVYAKEQKMVQRLAKKAAGKNYDVELYKQFEGLRENYIDALRPALGLISVTDGTLEILADEYRQSHFDVAKAGGDNYETPDPEADAREILEAVLNETL